MTVALKSRSLIPPVLSFFLKIAFALQGLLCFPINCEIFCCSSVKNTIGSLIGIALNLYIALGSIIIFTILIFPIQEHGISLHVLSFFFPFIFISWRLITLQYCSGFCHTLT